MIFERLTILLSRLAPGNRGFFVARKGDEILPLEGAKRQASNESLILAQNERWRRA